MPAVLQLPIFVVRLLALAGTLFAANIALADDYSAVSQLMRSGKMSEALAKADQHLASKPRDPQMRFLRGVILSETGKSADAIVSFTRLTEDYPELPEPYNNLAVLYAGQNQFDKARNALEMAIRTNPSYATAHENLGDVYARLASQAYSRALQLDGSNANLQPKLALIRELFSQPRPTQRPSASTPESATAQAVTAANAPAPSQSTAGAKPTSSALPAPVAVAPSSPAPSASPASAPPPVTAKTTPAPAAVSPASPSPGSQSSVASTGTDVETAVRAWAAAWSAKDMATYLSAYGKEFDPPGDQSRRAWEDERRSRILSKSRISIKLSEIQVQSDGHKATVKFRQAYNADSLNVSSRKTLEMRKVGERWVIVRESTGT